MDGKDEHRDLGTIILQLGQRGGRRIGGRRREGEKRAKGREIEWEEEVERQGATTEPPPPAAAAAAPKTWSDWFRRPEVLSALNPEPFNEEEFMFKSINDPDPDPEMEEQIQKLKEQGREEAWAKVSCVLTRAISLT